MAVKSLSSPHPIYLVALVIYKCHFAGGVYVSFDRPTLFRLKASGCPVVPCAAGACRLVAGISCQEGNLETQSALNLQQPGSPDLHRVSAAAPAVGAAAAAAADLAATRSPCLLQATLA
jgi:hypothetical protein